MCSSNNFKLGIIVSIWTVVQTSFHLVWVLFGYYFYTCRIKLSHYGMVIFYLTYFYKHDCGDIIIDSDIVLWRRGRKNITAKSNITENEDFHMIVQTILEKAILPKESYAAWRTNLYFYIFIFSDAFWIASAFLLFAGTCFQMKKCLSLMFYCPWIITAAFIILIDVVSAVHYGLDIYRIHNFTSWLNFIGVENYKDFSSLNSHHLSSIIPILPSISLCILFARFLIIWILNVIHFFQIMHIAVMAFQDNLDGKNLRHQRRGRTSEHGNAGRHALNVVSSEDRIRSWQNHYGPVEIPDMSRRSSLDSTEIVCTSNNSVNRSSFTNQVIDVNKLTGSRLSDPSLNSYARRVGGMNKESSRSASNISCYYQAYPDVAEDISTASNRSVTIVTPSRSQLPWSYFEGSQPHRSKGHQNISNISSNSHNPWKSPYESYRSNKTNNTEL